MLAIIELYLKENIDSETIIERWDDVKKTPMFLRSIYRFHIITILKFKCILLEIIDEAPGVDSIKKHMNSIEKITDQQIILYYKQITRYRRKSLIENNISFIIEDGQMFLPFLGLHFKNTDACVEKKIKIFTPSAQIAYLYFLYNKEIRINITEFSEALEWSKMTASRALSELYNAKLLTYEVGGQTGRSKYYKRVDDPDYFERARELLSTPINKIVYVKVEPEDSFTAGLEALSELSMINPPGHKVRAIYGDYLNNNDLEITENYDIIKDKKLVELQIWKYNPKLFQNKGIVDIMSLYLSLKEENDERIEQAMEEVLRGEKWYTD